MSSYFTRRLRLLSSESNGSIDENGLLGLAGSHVVLGEPGMGKSELLRELGRQLDVQPVTAVRFLLSKNPAGLVTSGKPLLIDGLDEAMARREGDAVDAVLEQLADAGAPTFIISCRSREWQARTMANLLQIYGLEPNLVTIEPLDRDEASAFLATYHPTVDAQSILGHLDAHRISDLYRNPLTLDLMGRVADSDIALPSSRGVLFDRVCKLIWPEHNPNRQDAGLAQLCEADALSAAGAMCAAMLLGGAEALTMAGAAETSSGDIRIVEVTNLPNGIAAPALFHSKLFRSCGHARVEPIHRVVAEYLGAHWLANQSTTPRLQRRLLAQFHGSGAVPASLRGLHAWLAYHSPALAERIIAADPYGVLRYGEADFLTPKQALSLFEALIALSRDDPWFRSRDWDSHAAKCLMVAGLKEQIDNAIGDASSSVHLRSLLIEGLNGTALAGDLADTLEGIVRSPQRFYRERADAAEALLPYRDRIWWQTLIHSLIEMPGEENGRLARTLMELIEADAEDDLVIRSILAELELLVCPWPRENRHRVHTLRRMGRLAELVKSDRICGILDLLIQYGALLTGNDRWSTEDVADFAARLVVRAIDESLVGVGDGARLWQWLKLIEKGRQSQRKGKLAVRERLRADPELRHAVQEYGLYGSGRTESLWAFQSDLHESSIGLGSFDGDVAWFLTRLSGFDNKDEALREDWQDLLRLGRSPEGGFAAIVRQASEGFSRGDRALEAARQYIEHPKVPAWEKREQREKAKRERKERIALAVQRQRYQRGQIGLRAGELNWIYDPSRAYFGHFSDIPEAEAGAGRIEAWIGAQLAADVFVGFEACLHRSDIPTVADIVQGFAENVSYSYSYAIIAGLAERSRTGTGFAGLHQDVLTTGLLLLHEDDGWYEKEDLALLTAQLEAIVIPNGAARQAYARLMIEPSLAAGTDHIGFLYRLGHNEDWIATGGALAKEWLVRYPGLSLGVENALLECLTHANDLHGLKEVAQQRASWVLRDYDHLLSWLAIDVLVRFDEVRSILEEIGSEDRDFLWFLRDRIVLKRRGAMVHLDVEQSAWIIAQFRTRWPYAELRGSSTGNGIPHDATDFLRGLINRLANDVSQDAGSALVALIGEPEDSYTDTLRHMAAEQRQKMAEKRFAPTRPAELGALLQDRNPANIDDLRTLALQELEIANKRLGGSDIDEVRDFWTDDGKPRDENRCRDRLAGMIGPELLRYDIQRILEADMPATKRVDLAFAHGPMQLPMEVKGQWHPEVWNAATDQLDAQYLIDWRSDQRGIYCIFWFGELPERTGRRLKAPPEGVGRPTSAAQMREAVMALIPENRRASIDVVVMDCSPGRNL
ncbi:hypothetical protein ASE85_18320 [Sphingobium sp. Leaf26]|nr:hypothetical protein ASE85_18320 [Sphingobium sp. Leaf26]